MCGIVGIVSHSPVADKILESLKRLEYRGYDSSGIATLSDGRIEQIKAKGRISSLISEIKSRGGVKGNIGIAHTRWATHGKPSILNSHPHSTDRLALVHNGVVENFEELKDFLGQKGRNFSTDTDTEVIAKLIDYYIDLGLANIDAVRQSVEKLQGSFAIAVIFLGPEEEIIVAKRGAPLAIGFNNGEAYIASDSYAIVPYTNKISYLEEGDLAAISRDKITIYDECHKKVSRAITSVSPLNDVIDQKKYKHFMLKEINEQPQVLRKIIGEYGDLREITSKLNSISIDFTKLSYINIIACGTSYYAAMVTKYWLESIASTRVNIDIASEFRYRSPILLEGECCIFVSQSGETADTLAALKFAKKHDQKIISILNMLNSSIARESDLVIETLAGVEIGVASTKVFTAQLTVLLLTTLSIANIKDIGDEVSDTKESITKLPDIIAQLVSSEERIIQIAKEFSSSKSMLFMGRGANYPIALEGALKLKEISYIHAEGIAAGELKHGVIALVDEEVPVVVMVAQDELYNKSIANVQEVIARGARVIIITDSNDTKSLEKLSKYIIEVPKLNAVLNPISFVVPLQLFAYHIANLKGTDIDQPRNLAKSVTVE
jgi:glutamine---fructose-6-phosphate transaminase (isomerizing)